MQRTKWTERVFTFDFPTGWLPNISERLLGTAIRAAELCRDLDRQQLTEKKGDQWSIQEHIGHLLDLEELHEGRIDDFLAGKAQLRPADMSNAKTRAAEHNEADLQELLEAFRKRREQFVSKLWNLDDETHQFRSMHPRLQVLMRPVDMAFFTAEHDDHHLATVREMIKGIDL